MNLTPTQIIIIGGGIVFGVPIAAGIVVGHFAGTALGVIAGVVMFIVILMMAHRKLVKMGKDIDDE